MQDWADKVEKRTDGLVKIETYPGGSLLSSSNMYDGVAQGVADIGCSSTSYEPGRFPLLSFDRMIKSPSAKVMSHVVWDIYEEFKPESLANFKVLYMYTSGPHYIITVDPMRNLEDLKGTELRAAPTSVGILEALGAAAVGLPQSEVPEALQKGTIEGYHSSLETLMDFKYAESCKYGTDWTRSFCIFAVAMNQDKWDSLPQEAKNVFDELRVEQSIWTGEYMDNHCRESVEWAKEEQGWEMIELSREEKAKWDEQTDVVIDDYVGQAEGKGLPGQEVLNRAHELIDKYTE